MDFVVKENQKVISEEFLQEDPRMEANNILNYYDVPSQIEQHLDLLCKNKGVHFDNHIILGSSNLNGRYWNGSVWYFHSAENVLDIEKSNAGLQLPSGIVDGIFITDDIAVIAQDCGYMDFVDFKKQNNSFAPANLVQIGVCGDSITCMSSTCDYKTIATGNSDMSIKLWDIETYTMKQCYYPAHSLDIFSLSCHPTNPFIFLSASLDGNVLLWDTRLTKPAMCIMRDSEDAPTAVTWMNTEKENLSNTFLVGTESGHILLRNCSVISYNISAFKAFNRPLYKFFLNPYIINEVACCADEEKVSVFSSDGVILQEKFSSSLHSDFVRSLVWLSSTKFISCGWDKAVHICDI